MKNIPHRVSDRREDLPIELVMAMLNGAVDALELDGTEDCTKGELKQLFRDLAEVLYLEDAGECVRVIMTIPALRMSVEGLLGSKVFVHKAERLAMVSAEIARREIDQMLSEQKEKLA